MKLDLTRSLSKTIWLDRFANRLGALLLTLDPQTPPLLPKQH